MSEKLNANDRPSSLRNMGSQRRWCLHSLIKPHDKQTPVRRALVFRNSNETLPAIQREVFEPGAKTWREHFANQDSSLLHIFNVIISSEKIFNNINCQNKLKRKTVHFRLLSNSYLSPLLRHLPSFFRLYRKRQRNKHAKDTKKSFPPSRWRTRISSSLSSPEFKALADSLSTYTVILTCLVEPNKEKDHYQQVVFWACARKKHSTSKPNARNQNS